MVARINSGKSVSKALNYNEQKVQQGRAEVLYASGFLKNANKLSFYDKINHFKRHTSLNERTLTNTLHVSLNFDPTEKISNDQLSEIAGVYMDKIGFGNQPYLVYRHYDAGHPHIHIVSTNIERDGNRISMHNLGRNQSEKARIEIEMGYKLVRANTKGFDRDVQLHPIQSQKVIYGKTETRRAIANVLDRVLDQYKYGSLPELNAVLKLYNVVADPCAPDSRIYKHKGLVYRVLDDHGNKVGLPIKASAFHMKPTLINLEAKFSQNEPLKAAHRKKLQASVQWSFEKKPGDLNQLVKDLEKRQITTIVHRGKEEEVYGITFIDHTTKCVFKGSDLGNEFSVNSILARCDHIVEKCLATNNKNEVIKIANNGGEIIRGDHVHPVKAPEEKSTEYLMKPIVGNDFVPYQLVRKRRRKRKRFSR